MERIRLIFCGKPVYVVFNELSMIRRNRHCVMMSSESFVDSEVVVMRE